MMDALRLEGVYTEPTLKDCDVELYDPYYHVDIPFGGYTRWDPPRAGRKKAPQVPRGTPPSADDRPYITRLGGFSRKGLMDPEEVAREFRKDHGFDLPIQSKPKTPKEAARRITFWRWIRRKFDEVYRVRAEVAREFLPNGVLISNLHWTTQLDTVMHGDTLDIVGINTRPMMLDPDNEVGRRYETGYAMRLWADLTGRPIMAAPRANILACSPGNLVVVGAVHRRQR